MASEKFWQGLGDISVAAALPELFLVALHGEGSHGNDRDRLSAGAFACSRSMQLRTRCQM
jgi:hypothetical protein